MPSKYRRLILSSALLLAACGADPLRYAPPSPERPWRLPESLAADRIPDQAPDTAPGAEDRAPLRPAIPAAIPVAIPATGHRHTLAELVDLAQRINPRTREAWEKARQAAYAVGLAESEYLPQLSAEAVAGYQRTPLPIPTTLVRDGYFTTDTREVLPTLTVKWLLFDFGRRENADIAARENAYVANVAFTGEHQRLVYAVSRDYFAAVAAHSRRRAAERGEAAAREDLDAVTARRTRGLATTMELAQARRQQAKAEAGRVRAEGEERRGEAALAATVGLPPGSRLDLAEPADELPTDLGASLDHHLAQALARRPDLLAKEGQVRAAAAEVDKARAEHRPTLSLAASVYRNFGALSTDGERYYSVDKPGGALFLLFNWPLFDGGLRDARIGMAQARREAAAAAAEEARVAAGREVSEAYYALEAALAEARATRAGVEAAREVRDAARAAYDRGTGTFIALEDASAALAAAEADLDEARTRAFSAAAALAFATGAQTTVTGAAQESKE